jgi:hypothetical protein
MRGISHRLSTRFNPHPLFLAPVENALTPPPPPPPLRARAQVTSLLDHVLEGFSATLFAYGPTGSGKTFSITGVPDAIVRLGSGEATDGVVIRRCRARQQGGAAHPRAGSAR